MIIYAIKIKEPEISTILNLVKYLCAPNSKTEVHVSVRGPYKRKMDVEKIEELNKKIENTSIRIKEIGNFFLYNQNTVYLKCVSTSIQKVWDKKNYGFNPHLTLYDGDDINFAAQLYQVLNQIGINISFKASALILYDTSKLDASTLLTLGIDTTILKEAIGLNLQLVDPAVYSTEEKLDLIKKCFIFLNDNFNQ